MSDPDVVEVQVDNGDPDIVVVNMAEPGIPGPPGVGASFEHVQTTPLATWSILVPIGFDRRPAVDVFLAGGRRVIADVDSTPSSVTVTFASPQSGTAVLT
jgi:hypothetical protein